MAPHRMVNELSLGQSCIVVVGGINTSLYFDRSNKYSVERGE